MAEAPLTSLRWILSLSNYSLITYATIELYPELPPGGFKGHLVDSHSLLLIERHTKDTVSIRSIMFNITASVGFLNMSTIGHTIHYE